MKPIDYIVIGIIIIAVVIAIVSIIVDKKKGKSTCGCDCANCAGCSSKNKCPSAKENNK